MPPVKPDPALTLEAAFQKWEELLKSVDVDLGSETSRLMIHYLKELKVWNRRVKLISVHSDEELLLGHLLDSLMLLRDPWLAAATELNCVDVGSGNGFPGLPLRFARPGFSMALVESVHKKANFLQAMVERYPLKNCAVLPERAEDAGRVPNQRASYDAAFCRAVGRFTTALELTLPLLKTGGSALLHRGADAAEEVHAAAGAIGRLGGRLASLTAYQLPHLDKPRYAVRVEKTAPTPEEYPRRAGVPAKRPL